MKTQQASTSEKATPNDLQQIKDFFSLRVLRQNGLYGVTLPIVTKIMGTSAQTAGNFTTPFFIANRSYQLLQVVERHETAGSDAGTVTLMLMKVHSGTAPASGISMLTAGINLKATANTNQTITTLTASPQIVSTATLGVADAILQVGDALSLVTTGTLTALVGVTVSVLLKAI